MALSAATATATQAQAWDDRIPNIVAVGFGGTTGGLGMQYLRQLGSVPLAIGAGLGALGPATHIDLTLPALPFGPLLGGSDEAVGRAYVGLGLLVVANRASDRLGGGELLIEAGTQRWPQSGGDRFFTDVALGVMVRAWGPTSSWPIGPGLRAQVGYAF